MFNLAERALLWNVSEKLFDYIHRLLADSLYCLYTSSIACLPLRPTLHSPTHEPKFSTKMMGSGLIGVLATLFSSSSFCHSFRRSHGEGLMTGLYFFLSVSMQCSGV